MAGKQKPKEENLFEELVKLRDMHRKRVENAVIVVKGKDRPLEKKSAWPHSLVFASFAHQHCHSDIDYFCARDSAGPHSQEWRGV